MKQIVGSGDVKVRKAARLAAALHELHLLGDELKSQGSPLWKRWETNSTFVNDLRELNAFAREHSK